MFMGTAIKPTVCPAIACARKLRYLRGLKLQKILRENFSKHLTGCFADYRAGFACWYFGDSRRRPT
jgi:hypothetical protein